MWDNLALVWENIKIVEPRLQEIEQAAKPAMFKLEKLASKVNFMEMSAAIADMFHEAVEPPPPQKKAKKPN